MKDVNLRHIATLFGQGNHVEDIAVSRVSTDSRDIPEGCLFVALAGDNFDGHDFAASAIEGGAAAAVVSEDVDAPAEKLIRVGDTRMALLKIAGFYRDSLDVKVVAVTGSVGKTTTKEMIACVCESRYKTLKTRLNLNNEIGTSQMMLELEDEHEVAVLEMGMDGPGQISPIAKAASPDISVVTNIGVSHLEAMGTRENIRDEKLSVRDGMKDGSILILCADDEYLRDIADDRFDIMLYGLDNPRCEVRGVNIMEFSTHTTFEIIYNGLKYDAQVPCMGRHSVYNALAAFCVGVRLGIPAQECIAALKNYRPAGMRQNIVVHNSFTVVEDCYNASPDSMRAALRTLGGIACEGKRIAVLSDMLELGGIEAQSHINAGKMAAEYGVDYLLCTGRLSVLTIDSARKSGIRNAYYYASKDDLFEALKDIIKPGDVVWFKASRGMKLEDVIARVYAEI